MDRMIRLFRREKLIVVFVFELSLSSLINVWHLQVLTSDHYSRLSKVGKVICSTAPINGGAISEISWVSKCDKSIRHSAMES